MRLGVGVSDGRGSSWRTSHHPTALLLWTEVSARGAFHLPAAPGGPLHQGVHQPGDWIAGGGGAIRGTCLSGQGKARKMCGISSSTRCSTNHVEL